MPRKTKNDRGVPMKTMNYIIRIDPAFDNEVNKLLNKYSREEFKNKSEFLRKAMEIGLLALQK